MFPFIQESHNISEEIPTVEHSGSEKITVISLGGSVVASEKINTSFLAKFSLLIRELEENNNQKFVIVVGGGKTCRDYVNAAKVLGSTNYGQDMVGIAATRLNAFLVIQLIPNAHEKVLQDISLAKTILNSNEIPIYAGLLPGFTTDTIAALLADSLNAEFINISNVKGIYSADPKTNPSAEFYDTLNHDELVSLIIKSTGTNAIPGQNVVIDLPCSLILKRSKIRTKIVSAENMDNLRKCLIGDSFIGTILEE